VDFAEFAVELALRARRRPEGLAVDDDPRLWSRMFEDGMPIAPSRAPDRAPFRLERGERPAIGANASQV